MPPQKPRNPLLPSYIILFCQNISAFLGIPGWVIGIGLLMIVGLIPLSIKVSPWIYAYSVPVRITMSAPSDLKSMLCWGEESANCAPLVAYDGKSPIETIWLSELPAFPVYSDLYIRIDQAGDIQFDKMVFDNPRDIHNPLFTIDQNNFALIKYENITVNGRHWTSSGGGKILLPTISHRSLAWWQLWLIMLLLFLFLGGMVYAFWQDAPGYSAEKKYPFNEIRVLILFLVVGCLQVLIVQNGQVFFNGGDTNSYLVKAIALSDKGTYDTGGFEYELNRLPGYPLFMAIIFKIFGYQLSNISFFQASLYSLAVYSLTRSFRQFMPEWLLVISGSVAIFSPPAVWANAQLLSESLFVSLCLISIAIYIEYLRKKNWVVLLLYAAFACSAFFVRANGIILFILPVAFLLKDGIEQYKKSRSFPDPWMVFQMSRPIVVILIIVLIATGWWSFRNYRSRGYFGLTDYTNLTRLAGQFFSGTFDFRSLNSYGWLDTYLRDKYDRKNVYYVWNLRPRIYDQITDHYTDENKANIKQLDQILGDIYSKSEALIPWEYKVVSYLRNIRWSIDVEPLYDGSSLALNFFLSFDEQHHIYAQEMSSSINEKIIHDRRIPGTINVWYYKIGLLYQSYAEYFIIATLITGLYSLRKNAMLSIPLLIFVLNMVLMIYLRNLWPRYIHILIPFVCFQFAFNLYQIIGDIWNQPVFNRFSRPTFH